MQCFEIIASYCLYYSLFVPYVWLNSIPVSLPWPEVKVFHHSFDLPLPGIYFSMHDVFSYAFTFNLSTLFY